jgi:hypothetical protein
MAVMKAKLAGNIPQLQALAMQGDFEAVAALKEMTDKKAYAQGMANETAMGQGDTLPVLEQMVGNLEAPQSGIAAYAGGGRAFADGGQRVGFSWDVDSSVSALDRAGLANQARRGEVGGRVTQRDVWLANNPQSAAYDDPTLGNIGDALSSGFNRVRGWFNKPETYSNEGRNSPTPPATGAYPEPVQVRSPATNKATVRKPGYSGIAAAAAPAETSPPSDGPFDPKKRMQRQEGAGMPDLPDASTMSDSQLRDFLAKQEPLQKKRDELDELSRKQLEAAYNAKVKNLTPSKFDRVMEFLAGVSAKGGSSAAQALGAGALAMHGKDKARQEQLGAAKETYDKADLLIQQAQVERQMGNNAAAYKLEQEAAALQKQIAAQKSTERMQGAQADYYQAQADFTRDVKPGVEQAKAARAGRSGIAAGAGAKPPNPVQVERAIQSRTTQLMKADPFNPMPEAQARAQAEREVRASIAGKSASPASPSGGVKFLGFE